MKDHIWNERVKDYDADGKLINNIEDYLDEKLVEFWKSEPKINPKWNQKPLETWRKIGYFDLNEIHKLSPIDINQDLVIGEKKINFGCVDEFYRG